MQTIVFENQGEIDIRSVCTFGVSVKEGDSPIGFFGTGLKYAIAVLLRTGHVIAITAGEQVIEFSKRSESVRGQEFDFVAMSVNGAEPSPIGFTTELGKQWDLWMAYREIACNCMDESGKAFRWRGIDAPEPREGVTCVVVSGDAFAEVHANRHKYFLEGEPDMTIGSLEINRRPSQSLFYRGVRVMDYQRGAMFTYNETDHIDLTEDRTVKDPYMVGYRLARELLTCNDEALLHEIVTASDDCYEGHIDFHWTGLAPGPAFMRVVGACIADRLTKTNVTAVRVWNEYANKLITPREVELTRVQQASMEKALDFCGRIGFQIRGSYPIKVVESLGNGCLGLAKDQTIYIAERVFHSGGTKALASTLIEEYLHLRQGWADLTRESQTFLFDKVVSLGEEMVGEPL